MKSKTFICLYVLCVIIVYIIVLSYGLQSHKTYEWKTITVKGVVDDNSNECVYIFHDSMLTCRNYTTLEPTSQVCMVTVDSGSGNCTQFTKHATQVPNIEYATLGIIVVVVGATLNLIFLYLLIIPADSSIEYVDDIQVNPMVEDNQEFVL